MRATKSDNNALAQRLKQQEQQEQQSPSSYDPRCNSKIAYCRAFPDWQLSCLKAENASNEITNKVTTTRESPQQLHHLLQRYYMVYPVIQQSAISLGKRLCVHSSRLLTRHKLKPAGYQQSSTATINKKNLTRTAHHIVINTFNTASSHGHHLHTNSKRCLTRSPSIVLLTLLLLWFSHLIGSSCAAPQSCVLCDITDFNDQASNAHAYEEYHFEHQVTRVEAITALKAFNASNYGEPSGCAISCSQKVMKYCLGPQFINDHCWCELGHTEEGLPFVPHICYVGEKNYKAAVGSCYFYEQVKECCCAPALAKQWRHISTAPQQTSASSLLLLTIVALIFNVARRHFIK
ncbi:uncharacterized protein LOC118739548 isoform X1 [Rhagoletis pomonella]|uniref:uncharacterized protein LOC118739548 isoform X1 n=1 Tax=Rhagoletis pomonella TaxID=28610 RepID=UPI00177E9E7E|nr:uncharacterized protein LOC118739548 isoform X1 [Rhagoletis pomonella]XP_036326825.1 uncharacterized protein LOC118739548 isoform X1 [Rhagoletis pomonella]XP_036326826.1 uncharacterized protein LOC118739548 isoform X1 [Rhagoletis pomonella]XP_036326827.1 uncharacterized protein LOC118739548 isoform X1 [Rhagoletis pomonella]XP_036326828.1 uncharacterized protein LOC118739548 isoform X1 [Rhagoletis pomonella]